MAHDTLSSPVCYAEPSHFSASFLAAAAPPTAHVIATCLSATHAFSKTPTPSIQLVEGLGVAGDCHLGATTQHRPQLRVRPAPANLRQVHLMMGEFLGGLRRDDGGGVAPGGLGENITTLGIDLLGLGTGAVLRFVDADGEGGARVRVTGLRNPCPLIERFGKGLQAQCVVRDGGGRIVERRAGVMGVVVGGGEVRSGMGVVVEEEGEGGLVCV